MTAARVPAGWADAPGRRDVPGPAPAARRYPWLPGGLLALTFFLLSADLLHVVVAGYKVKYGYFALVALWATAPRAMAAVALRAVRRVPAYVWLPLLPLAVAVAASVNVRDSVAWTLWLGFDAFVVATVYAYLRAHAFTGDDVRRALTASLLLMACGGLFQFVAIHVTGRPVLSPQLHLGVYRLNGVSGWPHFLNIFAFLLLPMVVVQRRLSWPTRLVLVLLLFVLVQSTAKTGWALFVALGVLLLLLDRRVFVRSYLAFLLPVVGVLLVLPIPSPSHTAPAMTATEKISRFSADLNLADRSTSGSDRVLITEMGLHVWWRHPWFGVGPRAYDDYVWTRFDQELPGVNKLDANRSVNAKNENVWVELLSECGALFTLSFAFVLVRALWVRRWAFVNRLHLGAWLALVLYFGLSGQFSQSILLTMVYAVLGVYFHARELAATTDAAPETRMRVEVPA